MNHGFSCLKEEAQQCWTVPKWPKVTNDPQFTKYARKNYIIDDDKISNDDKICNDDAKCYFSDRSLPLTKRKRFLMSTF
jgi:hypothetical protein